MSTRNPSKETMATCNPTQAASSTTQQTLTAYTPDKTEVILASYRDGDRLDRIAAAVDADPRTVARELRHADMLAPWDDPRTLAHLYHDYDHTLQDLADTFPDGPGPEMMRRRMERYGIERDNETLSQLLQAANPDDVGDPLPDAFAEGSRGERA
ncbi:helix-turn-helix domain-containing protein [Natrialba taiwanensis]|uniref:Uncharacterized protein n=1 Tax=Natrialba taiwanensis DSM 12281 TaxID=1230458 RepID=L9ZK87_9EURY|nr:helix-turn-helix domain-containing protein [Natrialba taiwanensis]ELY86456.1 hypothetical protein C484_18307 [Natrialba taiwanensis DSM 12281]